MGDIEVFIELKYKAAPWGLIVLPKKQLNDPTIQGLQHKNGTIAAIEWFFEYVISAFGAFSRKRVLIA